MYVASVKFFESCPFLVPQDRLGYTTRTNRRIEY